MAIGLGLLRLSPKDFWGMTPREFERAMGMLQRTAEAAPGRQALAELMRAFPDRAMADRKVEETRNG